MSAQLHSRGLWRSPAAAGHVERNGGELVYDRLKARILACEPLSGRTLRVKPLAEELGVSTTPVREALTRLAAERLLVASRHRGFFVRLPTGRDLCGLYAANEALLGAALDHWPQGIDEESAAHASVAIHLPRPAADSGALTHATAELFALIAVRGGIDELVEIVRNLSDRLHRVRCVECALIPQVREELATFAAAIIYRRRDDLRASIRAYHERRHELAPALCRELVIASYFPARRSPDST
jgi:DNA-binding GntR family transcriptional regulator